MTPDQYAHFQELAAAVDQRLADAGEDIYRLARFIGELEPDQVLPIHRLWMIPHLYKIASDIREGENHIAAMLARADIHNERLNPGRG